MPRCGSSGLREEYDDSATAAQEIVDGRSEALGANHPSTDNARVILERSLTRKSEPDIYRSREVLDDIYEANMAHLGPGHEDTLRSRGGLIRASSLMPGTDSEGVLTLMRQLISDCMSSLENGNPVTFESRALLAVYRRYDGNHAGAREMAESLAVESESRLGSEHQMTQEIRGILSLWGMEEKIEEGRPRE